jgi:hypothetical protein
VAASRQPHQSGASGDAGDAEVVGADRRRSEEAAMVTDERIDQYRTFGYAVLALSERMRELGMF